MTEYKCSIDKLPGSKHNVISPIARCDPPTIERARPTSPLQEAYQTRVSIPLADSIDNAARTDLSGLVFFGIVLSDFVRRFAKDLVGFRSPFGLLRMLYAWSE